MDLKDLPEVDYNDPETKKWLEEEDASFRKRHPNLSYEQATESIKRRISELAKSKEKA